MKPWGSALFPLTLLAALTALTLWLRYATEQAEIRHDGKHRHDPDYIVTDAVLRKIDRTGNLKYTLRATDIRHYPDDDTTDLVKPNLVYVTPKKSTVTLTADAARVSQDSERIDFQGNVNIHRAATKKEAALIATTNELTAFPNDETAFTRAPVHMAQGSSWVKGVGLQMDNRAQTYVLESQARAVLESRHAKKQKP